MPTCDLAQQILAALPRTSGDGPSSQFLALPSAQPRWLLPHNGWNIDSVLSSWSPYRFSSRLKWHAIRAASRVGLLGFLPNSVITTAASTDEIDWHRLGWSGSAAPVAVIYVGTPGISRKAVIHLVDRASGQCSLVVKVPLAEAAKTAIIREAGMLATLAEEQYASVPRLLYVDHARGIAAQTFLPGIPTERGLSAQHWDLLRALVLEDETTTMAQHAVFLQEHPLWPAACEAHPETLTAALSELGDTRLLPACWVHGDFAPWNIKRHAEGLALIDWEDAQRGGLPLHDLYHFLHRQDYLFGEFPSVHHREVEHFAASLGIGSQECRKLELAYLAGAYLQDISRQQYARARFLLQTLSLTLRNHSRAAASACHHAAGSNIPRPPGVKGSPQIRVQLFSELMAQLSSAGIRYCVLGGYDNESGDDDSDLDLMVHPKDLRYLPRLLERCARLAGGRLVQAMQHETTGCYFILAKQAGQQMGFLDPDCCGDYRRAGRLWLPADEIIAKRVPYSNFYLPAIADQFIYYLLKKVLKQSITPGQLKRLQHLYARDPAQCRARMDRFWSLTAAIQTQQAVVNDDLAWFQTRMPKLLAELMKSAPMEDSFGRIKAKLRDLGRRLRRAAFPTGLAVLVVGTDQDLRSEIADGVLQVVAPAFRRTAKVAPGCGFLSTLRLAIRIFRARRQSTLIVGTVDLGATAVGWRRHLRRLRLLQTLTLLDSDLVLVMGCRGAATKRQGFECDAATSPFLKLGRCVVHLDAVLSSEKIIAEAADAVLTWLAARMEQRLPASDKPFSCAHSFTPPVKPVELPSSGLD